MFVNLCFFIICCLLTLGQLLRIEWGSFLVFYPHDGLIALFLLVTVYQQTKIHKLKAWLKKSDKKLLYLVGWFALAGLIKWVFYAQPMFLLYFLRFTFYTSFLVVLNLVWQQTKPATKKFATLLPTIIAIISLIMYLLSPDMRILRILGWDDHYYRLIGPLLDPNFTGLILVLGILTSFHTQLLAKKFALGNFAAGLLASIALGLTFSRSAYLSLVVGLVTYLWFFLRQQLPNKTRLLCQITFLVLVLLFTIIYAPKPGGEGTNLTRTFSLSARSQFDRTWINLNNFSLLNWLIGPAENQTTTGHAKVPNNLWTTIFSFAGPMGVFFFLLWLINFFKKIKSEDFWLIACLLACLVYAQFNNILEPFVYLIAGITLIAFKRNHLRFKHQFKIFH